jgi:uncharacterized protein (TIRG00374 family)
VKTSLRVLLSVAAALLLLALLAYWGDVEPAEVVATCRRLPISTWALALAIHCGIYVARSLRFRILLPREQRPGLTPMLAIGAAHNLASYVLPARSGEASLVLYLRGTCGVAPGAAVASLVVSRALDLATLAGALSVVTLYLSFGEHWAVSSTAGMTAGTLLFAATLVFFSVSARGERLVGLVDGLSRLVRLDRTQIGARLHALSAGLADALTRTRGGGRLRASLGLSILMWTGVFLFYAVLARGFGLPEHIGLPEAAFGSSLAIMTNVLPINALAGFGTQETGWVLGFGLLGVDGDAAFATGVGVHLVQLANVVLLGILGHIGMGLIPGRSADRTGRVG